MVFDFSHDYRLENDVVLLRPLRHDDLQNLLPFAISEPTLWKYSAVSAAGEEGMRNYIATAIKGREQQHEYPFIVYDKRTHAFAGSTRFYDIQPAYKTTQLGYTWYGSRYQGTGLNKNCKLLLLGFAFDLGFERVEFRADNTNERSIAAMKSIGCTVEGVLRSQMPLCGGGRRDSIVLSILKSEWENGAKEALIEKVAHTNMKAAGVAAK